jgi:hypothetical protein
VFDARCGPKLARKMSRSLRLFIAAVCIALSIVPASGAGTSQSPVVRVTLTARNHQAHASEHWWYCVKVATAAGKSVASRIHLQILSGDALVQDVGYVGLKKGYDHWCAGIGGEASLLLAVPRGQKLTFQAVVRAEGVTVTRNWPLVVR